MRLYRKLSGIFPCSFNDSGSSDSLPWGTQCLLAMVICIIFGGLIRLDETFVCKGPYSFCTIESHNYFNIKKSKKLFIPKDVSFAVIEPYTARRDRRTVKLFLVKVIMKNKKSIILGKDFSNYGRAEELKRGVMTCIQQGPYPCKVKR